MSDTKIAERGTRFTTQNPIALTRRVANTAEVAAALGTGERRVRELIHSGRIRAVWHGRRLVIPLTEIDAFLEREMTEGQK